VKNLCGIEYGALKHDSALIIRIQYCKSITPKDWLLASLIYRYAVLLFERRKHIFIYERLFVYKLHIL